MHNLPDALHRRRAVRGPGRGQARGDHLGAGRGGQGSEVRKEREAMGGAERPKGAGASEDMGLREGGHDARG